MVEAVKIIAAVIISLFLITDSGQAATPKPTPKPSAKATLTSKTSVVKKSTAKTTTSTKKRVYKRYVRKQVKPIPSPAAKWPPANFSNRGSIYAKVPSASELNSYASNSKVTTNDLKDCEKLTCGAVFLASTSGCLWWQVDSIVTGPSKTAPGTRDTLGTLTTLAKGSRAKNVIAVILKSTEPLQDGVVVGGIQARCWSSPIPDGVPSNTYTQVPTPTPSST